MEGDTLTTAARPLVPLPVGAELWERVFTVAPLVLVGTKEGDDWDFAPKHMAMPLGWDDLYGFVCTPRHATYRNLGAHPWFTVSFPLPDQIVASSLTASGRAEGGRKPTLAALATEPARVIDGRVVSGCGLALECALERMVDEIGDASLVVGRVVAASAPHEALRDPDVDDADLLHRLGPLAYLHPGRFAEIRDTRSFPLPADFQR